MTLPASLLLSPSAANGLEACKPEQFALKSESSAECPSSSEVATVEAYTPLLPPLVNKAHEEGEAGQLKGELFVAEQECSTTKGCSGEDLAAGRLLHLYVDLQDPKAGINVKLEGKSKLNPETGRIETSFEKLPQLPFEELKVSLRGGQRAPFATAQGCEQAEGADTLAGALTPWSKSEVFSAQSEPITLTGCSKQSFEPKFEAGTEYPQAGHYSSFLLRFSRKDGEGDLTGLEVKTPPGLTAKLAGVPTCPEPQASEGECPATSEIGTATVLAGPGTRPYIQRGHVYLTGPYNGSETIGQGACTAGNPGCAPYGLSIVVSTKAGPFTLEGNTGGATQVTRAKIEVSESTAAVTVRSNPLPLTLPQHPGPVQQNNGIQLQIKEVQVAINRPAFYLNPTNCTKTSIEAQIGSTAGTSAGSSSFDVGGCRGLAFKPKLAAVTKSNTSKANGASLFVTVSQKSGEANIHKVEVQLPLALPSRLTTLQRACPAKQFETDRWACPHESFVGGGIAHTPLLGVPLTGPAVLVSHAGAAFPDLDFLLHGAGIEIVLVGHTQIKNGITYSKFESVPDQPITSFEAKLPIGAHSILAGNGYLCSESLKMPTTITAQNGAVMSSTTTVSVKGCPLTRPQKRAKAIALCRSTDKGKPSKRVACEKKANRAYAAKANVTQGANLTAAPAAHLSGSSSAQAQATPAAEAPPGSCPNEALRKQSNWDEATGKPYSENLPECRAYEMVSPVEKQGASVGDGNAFTGGKYESQTLGLEEGLPVSANGEEVGFSSDGSFAHPLNWVFEYPVPKAPYTARRSSAGWGTVSDLAPPSLVEKPDPAGFATDLNGEDLSAEQISCGEARGGGYACAYRRGFGTWEQGVGRIRDPLGRPLVDLAANYRGASSDLSHIVIQPHGVPLLTTDHLNEHNSGAATAAFGIYEIAGVGGATMLRLANVTTGGQELSLEGAAPALGGPSGDYHAISSDGSRVFFTATPPEGGPATIYDRETGTTTLPLSAPENCSAQECPAAGDAEYQGASSDGSKVFFTTAQQLKPGETDTTTKLFEYDFNLPSEHRLVDLSAGAAHAEIQGVVRTSADGSHVYFVAKGVLPAALPSTGEHPEQGKENLYGVDTNTGEVKFAGQVSSQDAGTLWVQLPNVPQGEADVPAQAGAINAQSSPDGMYLAFSTYAHLTKEEDLSTARGAYRYDFGTGEVSWLSQRQDGLTGSENKPALIAPLPVYDLGAYADIDNWNRALSNNGQDVVFTTSEKLVEGDINGAPDVYLWHEDAATRGVVSMISDGHAALGADVGISVTREPKGASHEEPATNWPAISGTGADVFFTTYTPLVPQDSDELQDLYDARVGGGIPAPTEPEACVGEGCLSKLDLAEPFGPVGSVGFTGPGNFAAAASASANAKVASVSARASARVSARATTRRRTTHRTRTATSARRAR